MKLFSIKSLTLLGFSLVAIPLVFALLLGASQVNTLAQNSEEAIINVARSLDNQQLLKSNQINMERNASQFLVLRDPVLAENYIVQSNKIFLLTQQLISSSKDTELHALIIEYEKQITQLIDVTIPHAQSNPKSDLNIIEPVKQQFNVLTALYEKIEQRSLTLNANTVNRLKQEAQMIRETMMKSLLIIPVSLIIAILFIFLITTPLKLLTQSILLLQQGKFESKIQISGSYEIQEIGQALDNMRTRLHALELQKSSFIRHISHELKTPLAAIREGTELLYDHSVGELNPEQQEISHIIKNSVFRLQQHIEDLLDFNIVLDSTSLQDSQEVRIDDLLTSVMTAQSLDIKRKEIHLITKMSKLCVMSNKKQIAVIIDNLLSNAIKFSPNNGTITIDTTMINDQLQITISDQGRGISAENKEKIFEAFYQGSPPDNCLLKGSGLGLTIVKELTLRLNGQINVLSPIEHGGTKMTLTLPRAFKHKEVQ